MNIPVLFDDEFLTVVNKPSGLLTIPTPKKEARTLTSILNHEAELQKSAFRFHPCHRLDRDTSGVIVYAKGKAAQQAMMDLFRAHQVQKVYVAVTSGSLQKNQGAFVSPIEGQHAMTNFRVISRHQGYDVVEVRPVTGRTNQIRLHFCEAGHPVLGDARFAFRRDFAIKAKRLMLHAATISFIHPMKGVKVSVTAELPSEFRAFMEVR